MTTKAKSNPTDLFESIKLGIDAHAKWYYVARQVDGATPQPVQKLTAAIAQAAEEENIPKGVGAL